MESTAGHLGLFWVVTSEGLLKREARPQLRFACSDWAYFRMGVRKSW